MIIKLCLKFGKPWEPPKVYYIWDGARNRKPSESYGEFLCYNLMKQETGKNNAYKLDIANLDFHLLWLLSMWSVFRNCPKFIVVSRKKSYMKSKGILQSVVVKLGLEEEMISVSRWKRFIVLDDAFNKTILRLLLLLKHSLLKKIPLHSLYQFYLQCKCKPCPSEI